MIRMVQGLGNDLVFGLRLLRKNLVLSVATVLTFTIGIGLNAGVFTVINGLLFRPRVAYDAATFVELRLDRTDASGPIALPLASLQDYDGVRRAASLRDVAAWTPVHAVLGDQAGTTVPLLVTCNFFTTSRARPAFAGPAPAARGLCGGGYAAGGRDWGRPVANDAGRQGGRYRLLSAPQSPRIYHRRGDAVRIRRPA